MRKSLIVEQLGDVGTTFTIKDLRETTDMGPETLRKFLYRLECKGWIERIERGKYTLLPLNAAKGEYSTDEFIIASMLVEPHCIAYWSALHHHGFTEQIPATVFVQTTSRKKNMHPTIFAVDYQIVRITPKKFYGIKKERHDDTQVNITDREKTLVDCLDKPYYCGGIIEAIKGLVDGQYSSEKLIGYTERIGNSGVKRRLGFINDYYGLGIEVPPLDKNIRNYLSLDTALPGKGRKNSKWKLTINLETNELEEARC